MEKHVVFLVLILVYLKGVSSLTCYVTEIGPDSINGLLNKTHKARNCNEQSKSLLPFTIDFERESVACFKIVGTDSLGNIMDIKGCIPRGKCDTVKDRTVNGNKLGQTGYYLPLDGKCHECEGYLCNSTSRIKGFKFAAVLIFVSMLF
ncbi:hypothetical protein Zmor_023379 [Zophobas morio]|uniref:Protein sleepless n=1 Tax=Zophobas morio TaxID=2755281 RepID=A0AA38M7A6_9CUCU|nr:hypothetical protein Zmor_023379 [Zophobas morio]